MGGSFDICAMTLSSLCWKLLRSAFKSKATTYRRAASAARNVRHGSSTITQLGLECPEGHETTILGVSFQSGVDGLSCPLLLTHCKHHLLAAVCRNV